MGKSTFTLDVPDAAAAPEGDRTVVYLGNRNTVEVVRDEDGGETRRPLDTQKRCTTIILPPGQSLMESAYDITHPARGVWQAHSDDDKPAWVASTDPALASLLAAHWGTEQRDPDPSDGAGPALDAENVEG